MASIPLALRQQVIAEAKSCCEYCQTQQKLTGMPLVIDHILPLALGGNSSLNNLAASCYRCNQFKGAKISSLDPLTNQSVHLFHPRHQSWPEHFVWANEGLKIIGMTSTGRATVEILKLNNAYVVESRRIWVSENWHPPEL
ncbi:MAG: HNH endonuclease [Leptolyngbyaceae cyanobacterium SM2_3_12]|nr:HNH endonuclease [Leptolyngbyaceae cyanobacterium SM2_3_12]